MTSDSSNLPRSSMVLKMPSAGGQVPRQTEAPASASALAMAKPKPPSSATPATKARFPVRSMLSMGGAFLPPQRKSRPVRPRVQRRRCAAGRLFLDGRRQRLGRAQLGHGELVRLALGLDLDAAGAKSDGDRLE